MGNRSLETFWSFVQQIPVLSSDFTAVAYRLHVFRWPSSSRELRNSWSWTWVSCLKSWQGSARSDPRPHRFVWKGRHFKHQAKGEWAWRFWCWQHVKLPRKRRWLLLVVRTPLGLPWKSCFQVVRGQANPTSGFLTCWRCAWAFRLC